MSKRQTVACQDCGSTVALTARHCPHCGSREFAGAWRTFRRINYERSNDNLMAFIGAIAFLMGGCYGYAQGSNIMSAIVYMLIYAVIGLVVAMPAVFLINLVRGSR